MDSVLKHFEITRQKYPNTQTYLQAGLTVLFSFVYLFAWLAHIPIYLFLGNVQAAILVLIFGVSSAFIAVLLIKYGKNKHAALSANLGGLTVLLAITIVTGATHSPIPAWLFFGSMTTFLLMGIKSGWKITLLMLAGISIITWLHMENLLPHSGFPFELESPNS